MKIVMREANWLILPLPGKTNPLLVRTTEIMCIAPLVENELFSVVHMKNGVTVTVDMSTGRIANMLEG